MSAVAVMVVNGLGDQLLSLPALRALDHVFPGRLRLVLGAGNRSMFYRGIPLLSQHFLKKSCKENGLPAKTVSQEAMRLLMAYEWPGNVRQFENAIEYAATMSGTDTEIGAESLPIDIRQDTATSVVPPVAIPDEGIHFTSVVSQLERDLILRCLEKTGGNKRQAARLLHLSRTTFIDKLQRLNVAEAGAA